MFWRLGFVSAWRNLTRSMLAILSMAMAAGFLTNAISLSRGYPAGKDASMRSLIGGEVVVYDRQLMGSSADESHPWAYRKLQGVENTDLAVMMPELFSSGYMTRQAAIEPMTDERLKAIEALPAIKAVYPRYQLPAMSSSDSRLWETPLRGRDAELDRQLLISPERLITEGRWFDERDQGQPVAVVSSQQRYPIGQPRTGLGDILKIVVPRVQYRGDDILYDYQQPLLYELRVIGVMDIQNQMFETVLEEMTELGPQIADVSLPLYMQCNEVQIPLGTWQEIWKEAGGREYLPQQLSLLVNDLSYVEDAVLTVQSHYPEYTVMSVPQLVSRAQQNYVLDDTSILINAGAGALLFRDEQISQTGMAMDLRIPLSILIFINAALVIASNLLIMVNERRTEIGILKAVGAQRGQVIQMILSEALLISVVGALAGFLVFRIPAFLNQLTNWAGLSALVLSLLGDLVVVLSVSGIAALIFGMLPALTMANLSVQEVLQSE